MKNNNSQQSAHIEASSQKITRRRFVQSTATTVAVTGAAAPLALAIDPVKRTGESKFKFSLAAYSYRSLLSGDKPQMSLHDFISDCAKFGLEGTELTSYYFPKDVTPDYLASLKQHCFTLGLDVSGTAVGNDFGHGEDDPKRAAQIQHVKTWVDHAAAMSAPVIRIFAGHHKKGRVEAVSHKLMVSAIEECCDYAGSKGVFLALENHGGPTATATGLLQFINDVQSPWFTVNLDTGNFSSDSCYDEIEQIAPYAMNVQVKVVTRNSAGESTPADFDRLAKILKGAAYRGYIVLEYEEKHDPRTHSPIYIEKLKEAFLG
ncbi:MAG: sugar phosphate isomerase/epimerase [Planctomycetaceae bacterium]|jgi:sugar phosphate isomerase/epimerase|nr:sugar phosphate isomerase/epimerase [Planctomycetaceae bacterium]MBT4011690.1 sugar phosphate isomerase/epimerase [Planctomycetaceae bacterium]MBT4723862.1 sugar phosphate isomerase/epimerase [Planctomycetaceae bacterium]MBT4844425.1 sugar phosphate isomerase/epimerase [Planctomycetaceae bacterium]MBT5125008.1 sugar phosphate isomerase/epimerase [Planctomycetaceae bacterium]